MSSPQTGKSFRFVRPCVPCERCEAVRVHECECLLNAGDANTKKSFCCFAPSRMLFSLFWPAGAWVSSDLLDYSGNLKFYIAWVLRHVSGFAEVLVFSKGFERVRTLGLLCAWVLSEGLQNPCKQYGIH